MESKLFVSSSPHVFAKKSTSSIMLDVIIALIPASLVGIYFNGYRAAIVLALAIISSVVCEYLIVKLMNRPGAVGDLSAVVTGLLIGMNLPATVAWWMPVVASVFAIIIVKHPFGGLGHNFVNPALAGRIFLVACWPVAMLNMYNEPGAIDVISSATPMAQLKSGIDVSGQFLMNSAIGNIAGCIGETSAIALLLGGIYLFARKVIRWRIPVTYIITVFVLSFLLGGFDINWSVAGILSGGLMLGAIYMATDYTTSPVTPRGQLIMGIGCGLLTAIIRIYSKSPEGVSYSILFMNVCVPLIDRMTRPKVFGEVKSNG